MMTGEKLGVSHEPRHGTAYVGSWVKELGNDPREIRAAAVDAQRISDWLTARERERGVKQEQPAPEPANREEGMTPSPEREAVPVRVGNTGERGEEAHARTGVRALARLSTCADDGPRARNQTRSCIMLMLPTSLQDGASRQRSGPGCRKYCARRAKPQGIRIPHGARRVR